MSDLGGPDLFGDLLHDRFGFYQVGHRHREADVSRAFGRRVLHDHVDVDVRFGERLEQCSRYAGLIGHAEHGDFGFGHVGDDTGNDGIFH